MKTNRFLLLLLVAALSCVAYARPQKRAVVIDTVCHAPLHNMLHATNRFCRHFQSSPDSLFQWAYVGMEEQEIKKSDNRESRDAIQLRYKDRTYDPKLKVGDVAIDVYVLGSRWWKDQHLVTKYVVKRPANAPYPLTSHMTATYSGSALEEGDFIIRMEPISDNETRVHYEFSLTFGKMLSAFISDKTWRNAIEWRFETILENLVEYAETGTVSPKKRGPKK